MMPPTLTYETETTIVSFEPPVVGETAATTDQVSIIFEDEIPASFDAALADVAADRMVEIEIAHTEEPPNLDQP